MHPKRIPYSPEQKSYADRWRLAHLFGQNRILWASAGDRKTFRSREAVYGM